MEWLVCGLLVVVFVVTVIVIFTAGKRLLNRRN